MLRELRVLVVDDDPVACEALKQALVSWGCECRTASDGVAAMEMLEADGADVILSDWQMPRMDGLELCRHTRQAEDEAYTYFIFMTGLDDKEHFLRGMEAGADDYQTKPIDLDELRARLASARRVVSLYRRLAERNLELRRDSQISFRLARRDSLTTVANRLSLEEDLELLWEQVTRYGSRYSAILIDIDWFKAYNDHFGHVAGDAALRAVAQTLRDELRQGDRIYRYGGEEFLVLLPEQSNSEALVAAERLRSAVERQAIRTVTGNGVLTISAGVAEVTLSVDARVADWISRADSALYRAKESGRNRGEADLPAPRAL